MKVKHLNITLISITILSIVINFNSFLMGNASSLSNIITTITYITVWFVYIWLSKSNRKNLFFSVIWSLFTFVVATVTLAVNINDRLIVDFVIPFAIIFITPLYGIEALFNQSWAIKVSVACIIISLIWFSMSLILLKMEKDKRIVKVN